MKIFSAKSHKILISALAAILAVNTLLFSLPFTASAQENPLFTFGLMTDVQYTDRENSGSRFYRSSPDKLSEAVQVFNREKVAFVLHLGDFINDNLSSFDTLLPTTGKLEMPIYMIPGNHEFAVEAGEKEKVLPLMGLKRSYRSYNRNGWRFILADGTETGVIRFEKGTREYDANRRMLDKLKAEGATNAFEWNGGIGPGQMKWIRKNLEKAEKKGERVILCCHFPLNPEKASELLLNTPEVKELIEKYPAVFAWLNGHVHVSRFIRENGVNYVSFRGMVEKEDNAFAIVFVYKDHLDIKGYGKEESRILKDN